MAGFRIKYELALNLPVACRFVGCGDYHSSSSAYWREWALQEWVSRLGPICDPFNLESTLSFYMMQKSTYTCLHNLISTMDPLAQLLTTALHTELARFCALTLVHSHKQSWRIETLALSTHCQQTSIDSWHGTEHKCNLLDWSLILLLHHCPVLSCTFSTHLHNELASQLSLWEVDLLGKGLPIISHTSMTTMKL